MIYRVENRPFNTTRRPVTAASKALVADVRELMRPHEKPRQRARKAADEASFNATLAALVADLVHRHIQTAGQGWLKVPMSSQARCAGDPILTKAFKPIVLALTGAELIELDEGRASADRQWQLQTRVRPTSLFAVMIAGRGVDYADLRRSELAEGDMIRLKTEREPGDWKGVTPRKVDLQETPEVASMRAEMVRVNTVFRGASVVVDKGLIASDRHGVPDVAERCAHRTFNGDLGRGGRFAGPFWLGMKKDDRLNAIQIDGEGVVGLDFGQMGLRTLYAIEGRTPPEGDLYAIPGLETVDRDGGRKALVSAMISSDRPLTRWPKDTKAFVPKFMSVGDATALVQRHHHAVAHHFGAASWGVVQRIESDIIVSVVLECADRGFVVLPVHDGLVIPRSRMGEIRRVMEQAFMRRTGSDHLIPIKDEYGDLDRRPLSEAA